MTDEQTPFPEAHAGATVLGTYRYPSREGELPELARVLAREATRPEDRAYVVWDAAVRGGTWHMFGGSYDMPHSDALDEFNRRIALRP